MRITALLLIIAFCIHACIENTQEKEVEFELNQFKASNIEPYKYPEFHLGGGLCVSKDIKYGHDPEWAIYIFSCYDSLPIDIVAPTGNFVKYKQGGLCFYHDCIIKPEESFTILMNVPNSFIDSNEYNIFVSKYNDSTMLYKHVKFSGRFKFSKEDYEYLDALLKYQEGKTKKTPKFKQTPKNYIQKDTIMFFKEYNDFWKELFSMGKPLKIKDEDFSDNCNSKFCSTKDFLEPLYEIRCTYGLESKVIECYPEPENLFPRRRIKPKCLDKLQHLSKEYDILMHGGAFPAGDCDLSNWRYLKIDSLNKEHYEKLKGLVKPPENY